ncbi:MAG: hypothetical protein CVU56_25675 [Deltaproteobacteria bacterium HGW-Deltaproteobacteria-14]|nr:MAG: hypothetical protein CVU56_25675 [Deltaproteobacteria bacterium HGW-Deltaproteobacteria-14]
MLAAAVGVTVVALASRERLAQVRCVAAAPGTATAIVGLTPEGGGDGELARLDAGDKGVRWSVGVPGRLVEASRGAVSLDGDVVVARVVGGDRREQLAGFGLQDGGNLWETPLGTDGSVEAGGKGSRFVLSNIGDAEQQFEAVVGPPAALVAVKRATGEVEWRREIPKTWLREARRPRLATRWLVLESSTFEVTVLSRLDGTTAWQGEKLGLTCMLGDALVTARASGLWAVDLETRAQRRINGDVTTALAGCATQNSDLVLATHVGDAVRLQRVAPQTGDIRWQRDLALRRPDPTLAQFPSTYAFVDVAPLDGPPPRFVPIILSRIGERGTAGYELTVVDLRDGATHPASGISTDLDATSILRHDDRWYVQSAGGQLTTVAGDTGASGATAGVPDAGPDLAPSALSAQAAWLCSGRSVRAEVPACAALDPASLSPLGTWGDVQVIVAPPRRARP